MFSVDDSVDTEEWKQMQIKKDKINVPQKRKLCEKIHNMAAAADVEQFPPSIHCFFASFIIQMSWSHCK